MGGRKYIRIALNEDDQEALSEAKRKAEQSTGIEMSDSMFVLSVLRKHIKE
jgi:hypothetical protein